MLLRHAPRDAAALIDRRQAGGTSAGWWRADCSTAGMAKDAYELCAEHPPSRSRRASTPSSTPAGSRCASSTTRGDRGRPLRRGGGDRANAAGDRPRRLLAGARRRAGWARATRRGAFTSAPPPIRSPITASSPRRSCMRRALALRAPASVATGDARDEATRVVELLYAARLDGLGAVARLRRRARPIATRRSWPRSRKSCDRTRDGLASVAIGKLATERGFALDESAFPTFGVPGFAPLEQFGRSCDGLCGRAAGERIRRSCRVRRRRQRVDANPAVDRPPDGEPRRRRLRRRAAGRRSRLQHATGRGLSRAIARATRAARAVLALPPTTPAAGRVAAMDRRLRRSARRRRRSRRLGRDASRSTKLATTCSGSMRICRSMARVFRDAGKAPVEPQTGRVARADF